MADYTLGTASLDTEVDLAGLFSGIDQAERATRSGFERAGTAIKVALGVGLAGAGVALAGFASSSISAAGDFEAGMNRFASVTGEAVAAAGFTLDDFQSKFLELGAITQFSAAQAQDAAINLAKGGVSVADIMGGATQATLDLAAAGELDLAPAADIVARQLGVWAETGVEAAQVANLLAQAANASTVDVQDLALGLAQAGGTAKTAGVDYDDLVQTMALIAPNFSSAADAGTSLKTMLASLQGNSKPAREALSDLGLRGFDSAKALQYLANVGIKPAGTSAAELQKQLYDLAIQGGATSKEANDWLDAFDSSAFYDAQGNFVGMKEAARLLQEATKDLSEEQRIQAFQTIFGSDAIRAAAAIANAGAEGFDAMGVSMQGAGTAADQATQRNQGFAFAVDSLKGTIETISIVLGTALLPVLTDLINNAIIPAANGFLTFAQHVLDAGDPIGQFLAWIDPFMPLIAGIAASLLYVAVPALLSFTATSVMSAITTMAAWAPVLVPIMAVGAAVGLLYAAWDQNLFGMRDTLTAIWAEVGPVLMLLGSWLGEKLVGAVGAVWDTLLKFGGFLQTYVLPILNAIGNVVGTVAGGLFNMGYAMVEMALGPIPETPTEIPGYATGVQDAPGGLALVGEEGPELINLAPGADVFPADLTRSLMQPLPAIGDWSSSSSMQNARTTPAATQPVEVALSFNDRGSSWLREFVNIEIKTNDRRTGSDASSRDRTR